MHEYPQMELFSTWAKLGRAHAKLASLKIKIINTLVKANEVE